MDSNEKSVDYVLVTSPHPIDIRAIRPNENGEKWIILMSGITEHMLRGLGESGMRAIVADAIRRALHEEKMMGHD